MLKFTKDHEWVRRDGEIATVGITVHAQDQLGELVYAELPAVGKVLKQGEVAAVVESVKAASEIYAPVSGTVTEINAKVAEDPKLINSDAESGGWLFKLQLASPAELDSLMTGDDYQKSLSA